MCGICGVRSRRSLPEPQLVQSMMASLSHRGPDGSGYFRDEQVTLGHTRLAIVDTAHGIQPMCNEDEQVWVTFNGEIFNHVELARELRAHGHRFRTHCDTEVIVHAWEEWGEGCFERFNGQWALAIWDRRSGRLILSRDRLGVRPLFYTRTPDRFLFASEIKALFVDPGVPRELDPVGLDQTLSFWCTVAPRTMFAGVWQVPPGCVMTVGEDGESLRQYWAPSFPERGAEPAQDIVENTAALREAIIEAVRLRFLRADVPVGAYLSGGLDSAVTAAVISRFTDADLHTFSLRFTDREFDEGDHQQRVAAHLGTTHHEVTVADRDIAEVFPNVVRHAEAALLRTGPAPMYLLSKLVHDNGYKVVVTGEGADEVLAGYDIFRESRVREFWARDPQSVVRAAAVDQLYPWMARSPNSAPAFARGFFTRNFDPDDPARSHRPRWDATSALKSMLADGARTGRENDRDTGRDHETERELVRVLRDAGPDWDPLSSAQWLEMTTLLPGYILSSQGDRMLMANSVEGRFPFLDRDVVALAERLPARQKMLGLDEKHLLKRAFADLVPPQIVRRPKQPYRAPDASCFFVPDAPDWVDAVTSADAVRRTGVFRADIVERLLAKGRASAGRSLSNTDNMRVVAVMSVQLLSALFIESSRSDSRLPPQPMAVFDFVGAEVGVEVGADPGVEVRAEADVHKLI